MENCHPGSDVAKTYSGSSSFLALRTPGIHENPLIQILDHNILNEVDGLDNPTSENIARWFWKNIKSKIKDLKSVEIIRPRIGGCIYKGD